MGSIKILYYLLISQVLSQGSDGAKNDRPVIGILAQEYHPYREGGPDGTYIAASYVKMVEASGARVVPIMNGKSISYYEKLVSSLNGILLPGGSANLFSEGGYGEASRILYKLVLETNRRGVHFPLFGVCLGHEALAVISSNMSRDVLATVKGVDNTPMNLNFLKGAETSEMYLRIPRFMYESLRTRNITSNHHSNSVTRDTLKKNNLDLIWRPLTTNVDANGVEFISSMEHKEFPQIFSVQFHPEKIVFEWTQKIKDPHSMEAIIANRYFYDYFIENARWNNNSLQGEEQSSLIYNYNPEYTPKGYFEQQYIFREPKPADYHVKLVGARK